MCSLIQRIKKKKIFIIAGFLLMYAGFVLFFLPYIISNGIVALSENPQFFSFEDELSSISSTEGSPKVIISSLVERGKVVKCENGDYIRWNLPTPSRTMDLSFKIYLTKLPVLTNESMFVGEIFGINNGFWQTIFISKLYTDSNNYSGWILWTDLSSGHASFVSGGFVSLVEINRWYTIRITADLNAGSFKLYLDTVKLASIDDVTISDDVFIDFFRLGVGVRSEVIFAAYYDDIIVSSLAPEPEPQKWLLSITSSFGGYTNTSGVVNLDLGEDLTVSASEYSGYVFSKWIFDGVDYDTGSILTVPAKSIGSRHTLHALFINTNLEHIIDYNLVLIQVIGIVMIGSGGYILMSYRDTKKIL